MDIKEKDRKVQQELSFGDKIADKVTTMLGSWTGIIVSLGLIGGWIALNVLAALHAFDPYPFILLNLVLSCLAALQAPIIMMSQNRQAKKDRIRDDLEAKEVHIMLNHILEQNKDMDDIIKMIKEQNNDFDDVLKLIKDQNSYMQDQNAELQKQHEELKTQINELKTEIKKTNTKKSPATKNGPKIKKTVTQNKKST